MNNDLLHARIALGCLLLALSVGSTIMFILFRRHQRCQRKRELPLEDEVVVPIFMVGILCTFLGWVATYGLAYLVTYAITGIS